MSHHHEKHDGCCCVIPENSRRNFLTLATLGAGAALLAPILPGPAKAAGAIDALLLCCMDYRLVDDVTAYMTGRGLKDNYDQIILAGASLGALTEHRKDWGVTFFQHVDVAKQLHHIRRVMIMDHRDCGAYKVFLGLDLKDDRAKETAVHAEHLQKLAQMIKGKHPDLEVELLLMALDGTVEKIPTPA